MSNDLHIAFFMPTIMVGGVETTLLNILTELGDRNYRLTLLANQISDEFKSEVPDNVEIQSIGSAEQPPFFLKPFSRKSQSALSSIFGLSGFLKEQRPDALFSFQSSTAAVIARAISRTKCPLFVRESNTPSHSFIHDNAIVRRFKLTLKRILYSRANQVIAVSQGVADDLVDSIGLKRSLVTTIYNPTFTPKLIQQATKNNDHKWLNSESNVPVIISVGRLSLQKDFLTLINAFAHVKKQVDSRLIIVGEGPERLAITRRAQELGISDAIDLVGAQINPYKYLSRSTVFALSSIFEGLPNVVIEAVGCGLPVVSTDCPSGPREILLDGSSGILVQVGDSKQLAEGIITYLTNQSLVDKHVEAGKAGLERFTPKRAADSYLRLIPEAQR